jgi:hypothetical protein
VAADAARISGFSFPRFRFRIFRIHSDGQRGRDMIDRRQCVTGLAAAAILPALPAVAQADAPTRLTPAGWLARMRVR